MRLISFEKDGRQSFGIVVNGGVIDAGQSLKGDFVSLREVLAAGALNLLRGMEGLEPDFALGDIRYLPVIPDAAAKFLCVGVNYMPHIREMGRERPDYPVVFTRFPSTIVGHEAPVIKPRVSQMYDFEGELAVIIGRTARHVSRDSAYDYVAGYSCFFDGTARDYQRHALMWTPGKNFDRSGSFGPWMVTSEEGVDPANFHLQTRVNGEIMQDESCAELCFGIPDLIEYFTSWVKLEPGDVIATGTPGGVGAGRKPPVWLKARDQIEVEIEGIGTLRNTVVDEQEA